MSNPGVFRWWLKPSEYSNSNSYSIPPSYFHQINRRTYSRRRRRRSSAIAIMRREATPVILEGSNSPDRDINKHQQLSANHDGADMQKSPGTRRKTHKKWTSAFRVVQSITRFKNVRHHNQQNGADLRFSSNESTPTRTIGDPEELVDPVYLALKQATGKYGTGSGSSNGGSRRGSNAQIVNSGVTGHFESATPSPKNLSQTSLQDSGYSGGDFSGGSRNHLIGSTPQLAHNGIGPLGHGNGTSPAHCVNPIALNGTNSNGTSSGGGRRPKLSEKMKSLSLDCAEMPPPVQSTMHMMRSAYKNKPIRSARGFAAGSGESLDFGRSMSPPTRAQQFPAHIGTPRKLPPAPTLPTGIPAAITRYAGGSHVVIHEYISANPEHSLYLGDRLHILDNGDPDWRHGFKVNDRLEQMFTFPSTCVTSIRPGEQPMKLVQNCHLVENKLRLYRDQVVFAQPDHSIRDGKILIRNEHGAKSYCPLQYLMLL